MSGAVRRLRGRGPRRPFVLALALVCLFGPGFVGSARASDVDDDDEAYEGGRFAVSGSLTTDDTLLIDGSTEFRGASPPGFGLDVSVGAGLGSFELGLLVAVVSSGSTPAVGASQRLYAQARGTGYLRWSYVMVEGFDIFTGLGIGVASTRLSDFVRFELARDAGGTDREEVARSVTGLAVDVEAGLRIPLNDKGLRLLMMLAAHTAGGELTLAGTSRQLFGLPTRLHAGLEWRL